MNKRNSSNDSWFYRNSRKRKHINFVRDYVCEIHNIIFKNALKGEISPVKSELFKKYSKYLKLLEF